MRFPGFVYVMVNPRAPQLVRVGKSTRPPEDAAHEASLHLRDAAYFSDCNVAEAFVHSYLDTFHTSEDPELFEVPVEIALKALSLAMEKHIGTRANLPVNPSLYDEDPVVGEGTTAASLFEEGCKYRSQNDPANAMRYFKKAARLAEPRSFLALAEMTERGEGSRPDPNRSIEWLEEGARNGVRECSGVLADRTTKLEHYRAYFRNFESTALSPEQRAAAIRRMRVYIALAAKDFDTSDSRIIEPALAKLSDPALEKLWKRTGSRGSSSGSPVLKYGLALVLAGAIGIGVPMYLQRRAGQPASEDAPDQPAALADSAPAPAKSGSRARTKSSISKSAAEQPTVEAAPATPVIIDGSKTTEAPKPVADTQVWTTRTPPPQETASVRKISGEELREQFVWSKEKATAAFKDSVVKFSDEVTRVGKHDLQFKKLKCKFDGAPPARVEAGMTVTVEGTVLGQSRWTGTINVEHCRVLPN